MAFLDFTWYYIVIFLFVLTVLVFVHEWGHYWVARRNNVRVETFSIGFGPEIYGWTDRDNTRWKIGAIPLGGYVKMFGEGESDNPDEDRELTDEEKAVSFNFKTVGQRAAIVAAGPIINFLFAIVVFAGIAAIAGTDVPLAGIGKVIEGSAADEAGFQPGDRVLKINGTAITYFSELRETVAANPGVSMDFSVLRDEQTLQLTAVPKPRKKTDDQGREIEIGLLGVEWNPSFVEFERQNPLMALWIGTERTGLLTLHILNAIGDIVTGDRSYEEMGGPLRIAQVSGDMAQKGMRQLFLLMALLSVNLGLINLFPIPMLDGGHLVFFAYEAVMGRPMDERTQEYGFRFGLVLVLMLVVFVTWNDLVNLEVIEFLKGLVT